MLYHIMYGQLNNKGHGVRDPCFDFRDRTWYYGSKKARGGSLGQVGTVITNFKGHDAPFHPLKIRE